MFRSYFCISSYSGVYIKLNIQIRNGVYWKGGFRGLIKGGKGIVEKWDIVYGEVV